ncbi:hypothetical protein AMECASPLE_019489 [Ameca splendens]|uniref:Uncharacterized protein n=1 Tax=Ameca splendens TaxID=208324 RepID=A0ABV0YPX5_9TELE
MDGRDDRLPAILTHVRMFVRNLQALVHIQKRTRAAANKRIPVSLCHARLRFWEKNNCLVNDFNWMWRCACKRRNEYSAPFLLFTHTQTHTHTHTHTPSPE